LTLHSAEVVSSIHLFDKIEYRRFVAYLK